MPVQEGYVYADTPHEKTVAVTGRTYSCHSDVNGDHPRGRTTTRLVQDGWTDDGRRIMVECTTVRNGQACCHDLRQSDVNCAGCTRMYK